LTAPVVVRAMKTIMVRYKTSSPETSDKNAALVRAVFEELRAKAPGGIRYASYRMADGVTFVHIATHEGATDALTTLPSFKEFQKDIKSRCAEPPVVTELSPVGSYEGAL
jgi:quinol monooxygenase YgiN